MQVLVKEFGKLRKKFEPKRDKVIGETRRLQSEEHYTLYSSANTSWVIRSRIMRLVGHVARIADRRGAYRVLVGRPNGRLRHIWEDNNEIDFKK